MSTRKGTFGAGPGFWRPLVSAPHWPPRRVTRSRAAWALTLARAGYGVALLGTSGWLIRLVNDSAPSGLTCGVARVLGVRHVLQAGLAVAAARAYPGSPVPLACGAGIDFTHAASMVGLAGIVRSARRAALADAVLESALGVVGIVAAGGVRQLPRVTERLGQAVWGTSR
jgi:hypothetical protein